MKPLTILPTVTLNDQAHTLAETVYVARRDAGLTQMDLAAKIGCHHSQVSEWETGGRLVGTRRWIEVLRACGYKVVIERIEA